MIDKGLDRCDIRAGTHQGGGPSTPRARRAEDYDRLRQKVKGIHLVRETCGEGGCFVRCV